MNLPLAFKLHLESRSVSQSTVRNYLADLKGFLAWLAQETNQIITFANLGHHLTLENVNRFCAYLVAGNASTATINRRLSTLRQFSQFAANRGWLPVDPTRRIANISSEKKEPLTIPVVQKFRKHLEKQAVSQVTIKNYLSDLRHFLAWSEEKT